MQVRLWGVRGSLATPISNAQLMDKARALLAGAVGLDLRDEEAVGRYLAQSPHAWTHGGNTSCVEVAIDGHVLILDAGTGLRALGQQLMADGRGAQDHLHLLLTHFHWDHICGFPYFPPIYAKGRRLDVWSGRDDAEALLAVQMSSAHFPVKWTQLPSTIVCTQLHEDRPAAVGPAQVRILPMIHPDRAYGYRIDHGGRSVCYLTDTEVSKHPGRVADTYAGFVRGADVVIVDAMYGFLEYHDKVNYGHSTIFNFIDFFKDAEIGELVIFHHDPAAGDPQVAALLGDAVRYRDLIAPSSGFRLSAAREGQSWILPPRAP